jgi:hypothetical protein
MFLGFVVLTGGGSWAAGMKIFSAYSARKKTSTDT